MLFSSLAKYEESVGDLVSILIQEVICLTLSEQMSFKHDRILSILLESIDHGVSTTGAIDNDHHIVNRVGNETEDEFTELFDIVKIARVRPNVEEDSRHEFDLTAFKKFEVVD